MMIAELQPALVFLLGVLGLFAVICVVAAVSGFIQGRLARRRSRRARAQDMKSPERAWAHVILYFLNELDVGHFPKSWLQKQLIQEYGIDGTRKLEDVLAWLDAKIESGSAMAVVDQVTLLRSAAACQYVSQRESWDRIIALCRRLRPRFASWEELTGRLSDEYRATATAKGWKVQGAFERRAPTVAGTAFLGVPFNSI